VSGKRAWEISTAVALVTAVGAVAGGLLYYLSVNSALRAAMDKGDREAVRRLIRQGADIRTRSKHGFTVVTFAIGDTELLREAFERGANLKRDGDPLMLHYADPERARLLLSQGADPNVRNAAGETPLFRAGESSVDLMEVLIAAGAEVNARNPFGETPLTRVVHYVGGDTRPLRVLLAGGADVNTRQHDGTTPLMTAAEKGWTRAVELLLSYGADLNARDRRGRTALARTRQSDQIYEQRARARTLSILRRHGATE
jgi:uncharacterized protein